MAYAVKQLDEFSTWLKGLKDSQTRQRLIKRLRKAQLGNLGDVEKVGAGVFEMREHFGRWLAHVLCPPRRVVDRDAGRWR